MHVPNARDLMNKRTVTLSPEMSIQSAIALLLKNRISGAPVVDAENHLLGVLSEKDCLRIFANGAYNVLPGGLVSQYMSPQVQTIPENADLFTIAETFLSHSFRRLPVVDSEGRLIGQVSRRDVLTGSRDIWAGTPPQRPWTDAKYLTDEIKAALSGPTPMPATRGNEPNSQK